MRTRCLHVLVVWLLLAGGARAQFNQEEVAPLLFVRLLGPEGLKATVFRGAPKGSDLALPTNIGMRPGYVYRFRLTGLPGRPDTTLYPTIQILCSLRMPVGIHPSNFPVPIVFAPEDLEAAQAGKLITKVLVLEDPTRAIPEATAPDKPLEIDLLPNQNPYEMGQQYGRALLVIRFGERTFPDEELARAAIPNTILLPGEQMLPPPPVMPGSAWRCWPIYDPVLGKQVNRYEEVHDGGDSGPGAGFGPGGKLGGLNPTDTVAEYANSFGERRIAVSNRVRMVVPRYLSFRTEVSTVGYSLVRVPEKTASTQGQGTVRKTNLAELAQQNEELERITGRMRTTSAVGRQGTQFIDHQMGDAIITGRSGNLDVTGWQRLAQDSPRERPLVLRKEADKQIAQVGDTITFRLRYSNGGGKPITDIVLSDSLTGRLEYVPGSAKSDREAVFTTRANEAGSVILRWEIRGTLQPGQSGVVTFQAKAR